MKKTKSDATQSLFGVAHRDDNCKICRSQKKYGQGLSIEVKGRTR